MYDRSVSLENIIEGALLVCDRAMTVKELQQLFTKEEAPRDADIQAAIAKLQEEFATRGIELKEVASGYRIQARQELAPWLARLWDEKAPKYSRAYLETLVLIAYRQPITRAEIEEIRGVSASSNIVKTLMERDWVRVVGHRDVPGRPSLLATTKTFLDYFNLKSLEELPTLADIRDLDQFAEQLELDMVDESSDALVYEEVFAEETENEVA